MAQDFMQGWISGHLRKAEREKVCAALERMGLESAPAEWRTPRWELLDWFVRFAQRDIPEMTEAQCDELDEEVQTIQLLASFNLNPWIPTREELHGLATRILTILSALVDTGSVRIGPLPVEFVVLRGTDRHAEIPDAQRAKDLVMYEGWGPALVGQAAAEGIAFQVPPVGMEGLIFVLAQLISIYPGAVRRCPHCKSKRLFAQFRTSAKYCSRLCQSQAWAREQWERKKKDRAAARLAKEAAKKSRPRRNTNNVAPQKGGKPYGKKK